MSLNISKDEYYEKIWNLFPVLGRRPFKILKRDKQGSLVSFKNPNHPKRIKDDKYRSVVFVRAAATSFEEAEARDAVETARATRDMPAAIEVTERREETVERRGQTESDNPSTSAAATPVSLMKCSLYHIT